MTITIDLGPFQEIVSVNFPTGFKPVPGRAGPGITVYYPWSGTYPIDTPTILVDNPKDDLRRGVEFTLDFTSANQLLEIPLAPNVYGFQATYWGNTVDIDGEVTLSLAQLPPYEWDHISNMDYHQIIVRVSQGFEQRLIKYIPVAPDIDPLPFLHMKKEYDGWSLTSLNTQGNVTRYTATVGVAREWAITSAAGIFAGWTGSTSGPEWQAVNNLAISDPVAGIDQYWRIKFTSATTFECFAWGMLNLEGEYVGGHFLKPVKKGDIFKEFKPLNKKYNLPYFTIDSAWWGGTWAAGDILGFRTYHNPIWSI